MITLFNEGWSFKKTDIESTYEEVMSEEGWESAEIPHDWLIHQTKGLYETSTGWYRKKFFVGKPEDTNIIRFGGVYMDSTIYVNGAEAGEWKYGYSSFEINISKYLHYGDNEITVKVMHRSPNSRWYSGAGIFRNVYRIEHSEAYFITDGVYFSAEKSEFFWDVKLSCETSGGTGLSVKYVLTDSNGERFFTVWGKAGVELKAQIDDPKIWDIDNPELYTLTATLYNEEGQTVDTSVCRVGFRKVEFKPESGLWLNGKNVKIKGVCLHHDLGALGAAVNKTATKRQLSLMKEMGANAVRTSHNMPSVEFMEICDEMGILVDSEAFDMWELKKTDYDYARFFDDWYKKDVASWIRRDRNHPSVIMWSIGNEIYDTHASPRGVEVTKLLVEEVRRHDFNHNAYTTIGSNYIEWEGAQQCAKEVELSGYNYGERLYNEHHAKYPNWCIYGSETASRVQSRGIYHFPKSAAYITHDDLQCSSLENCRAGATERTAQTSIIADRDTPFCAGQFIWTGSDYIGEPSPYSTKNSYYGQIDTAGFKKDSYYLYQAAWTDRTVLHLLPYWDYNEGQLIDVMVYTNQPFAELFLNGRSLGKKTVKGVYSADWQVPYEKGELKAVSYDKDGNITAEDSTKSFGETAEIRLAPDKRSLKADGEDLIFLDISAYDDKGVFVANARNRVNVEVSGAGRLVGLDSGDSTDYDEYKSTSKKLFGGKLLAIIAGKNYGGDINVKVFSAGIPAAEAHLYAEQTEYPKGRPEVFEENKRPEITEEIPIRKIEIHCDKTHFDAENKTAEVTADILPRNAQYGIEWAAVTETGVITNIAEVKGDNEKACVTVCGDGKFRLRCFSRNGKPDPEVISELEMEVTGLGSAVIDPYSGLVMGSLYNISHDQLNEVSNGGVSIERNGRNMAGFKNVDFGRAGANVFSVSLINWHNNDEVKFSLWIGTPREEGSVKLGDFTYQADFIWQTYISNEFKLEKRIKGKRNICFEFEESNKRIYFGGFRFENAYGKISALDSSELHGDSFTVTEEAIEHIGNNVYIDFNGLKFSKGIKSVTVTGRTHNEKDSMHLRIVGKNGEKREILEFPHSEDYIEKTFEISMEPSEADIKFEFLPGCDFDLKSFEFNY